MDPHCNSPCPIALLLVAFAFRRPSCSNLGVSPSADSSGRPSSFWGRNWSFRERPEQDQMIKSLESGPGLPENQLDQIFESGPVFQIQTVRERRNFGEGISSRSVHGSSRHADLRHQEVWLTVQKLSIALNSKTASFTTWACTCALQIFF